MSKLSIHKSGNAAGYGTFLTSLVDAGAPLKAVFSVGWDAAADLARYSPTTLSLFRDQSFGATPPQMYVTDPVQSANRWYDLYDPVWAANPATYYAYINEEPLISVSGAQWINAFTLQMQRRAHAAGLKLCLFEFASGNPDLNLIQYILPAVREAVLHGDVWGQHAYWEAGSDQSFADGPLYVQRIIERLPMDAVPDFYLTEVSPGNGHNTVPDPEWFAEMDRADHALMAVKQVKALCAYDLGGAECDYSDDLPQYAALIIGNLDPASPPPTDDLPERVTALEEQLAELTVDVSALATNVHALTERVTALEQTSPPPAGVTATLSVAPSTIAAGQTAVLTWQTSGATSVVIPPFGPQALTGSKTVLPAATTEYVLTATGPGGSAQARALLAVTPPAQVIYRWSGVGVGDNQPLTPMVLGAFDRAKSVLNAVKLFTMPDGDQMRAAIAGIRARRPDTFILARLFFSVNYGSRFSPAEFVAFCANGLAAAYAAGVRYFEIHNEPNYPGEGQGFNWSGGAEFAQWLIGVLAILKPLYPEAQWGYPGLTSQPDTGSALQFFADSRAAVNACDWVGAHSYFWNDGSTGYGMTSPDGGLWWKRLRNITTKPLLITEFSCNTPAVDYATKGTWYRRYFELLKAEPQLLGAVCFALAWPGSDPNREGWVYNNKITAIPTALVLQEGVE